MHAHSRTRAYTHGCKHMCTRVPTHADAGARTHTTDRSKWFRMRSQSAVLRPIHLPCPPACPPPPDRPPTHHLPTCQHAHECMHARPLSAPGQRPWPLAYTQAYNGAGICVYTHTSCAHVCPYPQRHLCMALLYHRCTYTHTCIDCMRTYALTLLRVHSSTHSRTHTHAHLRTYARTYALAQHMHTHVRAKNAMLLRTRELTQSHTYARHGTALGGWRSKS